MRKPTYIIAEAGVNHNGSTDLACKLIDLARDAGVDAIKFQTFTAEKLATKTAEKAEYQKQTTEANESQCQMLKRLELSKEQHFELLRYAEKSELDFISTPFDIENLLFLVNELKLKKIKISSSDLTNAPLLYEAGRCKCRIILSTGMSNIKEIHAALGMLIMGYEGQEIIEPLFDHAIALHVGNKNHGYLTNYVSLLHCTSDYPTSFCDVNMLAMDTLKNEFQLETGLSDHSEGILIPIAATARGAAIIEKHITLDQNMIGPDHKASLSPEELHEMVNAIRTIEVALGSGRKTPCDSEQKNTSTIRKGIYVISPIKKGDKINNNNIAIKRPENELSPYDFWRSQEKVADKTYKVDDALASLK